MSSKRLIRICNDSLKSLKNKGLRALEIFFYTLLFFTAQWFFFSRSPRLNNVGTSVCPWKRVHILVLMCLFCEKSRYIITLVYVQVVSSFKYEQFTISYIGGARGGVCTCTCAYKSTTRGKGGHVLLDLQKSTTVYTLLEASRVWEVRKARNVSLNEMWNGQHAKSKTLSLLLFPHSSRFSQAYHMLSPSLFVFRTVRYEAYMRRKR